MMMNPAVASRILDSSYGGPVNGHIQGVNFSCPSSIYPGLEALHQECGRVYPTQTDPLQVKARLKIWEGGSDPLYYISIYLNPGTRDGEIPPHWHYVGFGLSDLYGDGRTFPLECPIERGSSGFGFELTFRLKKDSVNPPVWPGVMLQQLAQYCFRSRTPLLHGDHISWHRSLAETEESRLQHMLVVNDPELAEIEGPFGKVKFTQIVGATIEELEAAQHWNGPSFLELIKQNYSCGGRYLITDIKREESIFEMDPSVQEKVKDGIMKDGSTLSGVTAFVFWKEGLPLQNRTQSIRIDRIAEEQQRRNSSTSSNGSCNNFPVASLPQNQNDLNTSPSHDSQIVTNQPDDFSVDQLQLQRLDLGSESEGEAVSFNRSQRNSFGCEDLASGFAAAVNINPNQDVSMSAGSTKSNHDNMVDELIDEIVVHESVHVTMHLEAALLIPLVINGRVRHGRHFTFKSQNNSYAITFAAPYVDGTYADMANKFVSQSTWLQICLDEEVADKLLKDFDELKKMETVAFPITMYSIGEKFALTITL